MIVVFLGIFSWTGVALTLPFQALSIFRPKLLCYLSCLGPPVCSLSRLLWARSSFLSLLSSSTRLIPYCSRQAGFCPRSFAVCSRAYTNSLLVPLQPIIQHLKMVYCLKVTGWQWCFWKPLDSFNFISTSHGLSGERGCGFHGQRPKLQGGCSQTQKVPPKLLVRYDIPHIIRCSIGPNHITGQVHHQL